MSTKPLAQLIQERLEILHFEADEEKQDWDRRYILNACAKELEPVLAALNEVIKEIEEKKGNCLETIGSGMAWSGILDGKMAGFDVSLELLKGKADK